MFRKTKPIVLIAIFVVLIGIFAITKFMEAKKGHRSFKKELVQLDSAKVDAMTIFPKDKSKGEINLVKVGNEWKVKQGGNEFNADKDFIANALNDLIKLETKRIAAKKEDKWAKYELTDSLATHIIVKGGSETMADLYIGKFDYQQKPGANPMQQQYGGQNNFTFTSFIRLAEDEPVYAVDGMISMTFNRGINDFRNKNIIKSDKNNWTRLTFDYPGSAFTMSKQGDQWMIDGIMADSASVVKYLNAITNLTSSEFVDGMNAIDATHSLQIEGNNMVAPIMVKAAPADSTLGHYITSSMNKDVVFGSGNRKLFEKIFVPKTDFFAQPDAEAPKKETLTM